jgi:hypothetical protein
LKQKLVHFTIESESIKVEVNEEMRKNKEDVEHLIHLLKIVTKNDQNLSANIISLHCIYTHTCILNLNISQNVIQ